MHWPRRAADLNIVHTWQLSVFLVQKRKTQRDASEPEQLSQIAQRPGSPLLLCHASACLLSAFVAAQSPWCRLDQQYNAA